ncbi:hypothetical protein ACQPXT_25380 [Streptomyces sp. CA-100214]
MEPGGRGVCGAAVASARSSGGFGASGTVVVPEDGDEDEVAGCGVDGAGIGPPAGEPLRPPMADVAEGLTSDGPAVRAAPGVPARSVAVSPPPPRPTRGAASAP